MTLEKITQFRQFLVQGGKAPDSMKVCKNASMQNKSCKYLNNPQTNNNTNIVIYQRCLLNKSCYIFQNCKTRYLMTVRLPHQVNLFGFQQEAAGCRLSSFCEPLHSALIRGYSKI